MSLTAAASGFVVFLLSVQVIQGQDDWGVTYSSTEICALKGSAVEISCTYRYPSRWKYRDTTVERTFWFTKLQDEEPVDLRTDSEYSGRVQLSCSKKSCTLRITDLRESDSAEYKFTFITNQPGGSFTGSPGVTLSVTDPDLQVQVMKPTVYQYYTWEELKCHSSCRLPDETSYIWYMNGQNIRGRTSSSYSAYFHPAHSYSCAVKGREDFPSPSVCVLGQSCNRVTYSDRSICASKGSSVDISCTYNSYESITSKFWFRPERSDQWWYRSQPEDLSEDSQYAGRVEVLETERGRSTLRITDLRERDSAQYHFKFKTQRYEWGSSLPGTTLTVTALQVQVTRVTVHQSYTEAELKCHSSCSPAARVSYVWLNNGKKITGEETSSYKGRFSLGDNITCALKGHEAFPSPSVYAPKTSSVSVSPSAEIVEGSLVTLTCSSDANPAANYTWYKEDGNPNLQPLSKEPQLVFRSIQSSDSGEYYCTAENELGTRTSQHITINVKYAPKTSSVSVSPSGEIVEGSSVTLTCSSDANPAAKYTWYKEDGNPNLQPLSKEPQLLFRSIQSSDSGEYYCTAENELGTRTSEHITINVKYASKLPSVSLSPSGEIVEGSSVTLTCSSDANPAAIYTWYKENQTLLQGPEDIYLLNYISFGDSGNYHCKSENKYGQINSTSVQIDVQCSMKSVTAGSITAIVLAVIFVCAFLLIRRKRSSKQTTEPGERPESNAQLNMGSVCNNPSAAVQRKPAEEQDDVYYASVSFSKDQEDPLYSNIRPAQANRHKNEEEEDEDGMEYAMVNFRSASASSELRRQEAVEDSSALYSTVTKKPRV